jgi:hypothetical protein
VPSWIDELAQAMARPDQRWSGEDILDLVVAVADISAWLYDPRPYHSDHKRGWKSAVADFRAADQVGSQVQAALSADLTAARKATSGLPGTNTNGVSGTNPDAPRAAAQAAVQRLRDRWTDPAVLDAAWLDLTDACRDPNTTYYTIAARRDLFWQLVRAADRNTRDLSNRLVGILNDNALETCLVRVRLGDIPTPDPGGWPGRDDAAGLNGTARLDLCQRLLTAPTTAGHHVVWVGFDRARLDDVTTVWPITFYRGDWVRGILEHRGSDLSRLPVELTNPDLPFRHDDLLRDTDIVLARVDLGTRAFTDAPRVAAEQAQAVVALASFRVGDRYWRPVQGYIHAIDGQIYAETPFRRLFDYRDIAPTYHDATARQLTKLPASLASRLPITDREFTDTIDALRWWQDAEGQQPLAAVVLDVRVIDFVAERFVHKPLHAYLREYLAAAWVRHEVHETLFEVAFKAVENYRYQPGIDPQRPPDA